MAIDFAALKKKLDDTNSGGGSEFWKAQDGRNEIRILPSKENDNNFYKERAVRWNVGPSGRAVTVPAAYNDPCPIAEFVEKLKNSSDPDDNELAKKMRFSKRYLFNVIDMSLSEKDDHYNEVQVYEAPTSVFKEVLKLLMDPDYNMLLEPEDGFNIVIEKSGKGLNTEYSVRVRRNPSPVPIEDWAEKLNDLEKLATPKTYEERAAILTGADSAQDNATGADAVADQIRDKVAAEKSAPVEEKSAPAEEKPAESYTQAYSNDAPKEEPKPVADTPKAEEKTGDSVRDEIQALLAKGKK